MGEPFHWRETTGAAFPSETSRIQIKIDFLDLVRLGAPKRGDGNGRFLFRSYLFRRERFLPASLFFPPSPPGLFFLPLFLFSPEISVRREQDPIKSSRRKRNDADVTDTLYFVYRELAISLA